MPLSFQSPYLAAGFTWRRGNLHTHTTQSDGTLSPADTAAAYGRLGYTFLCISDHDTLTWPVEAPQGLIMIPGVEVGGGPHILAVGVETVPSHRRSRQKVLDEIAQLGGIGILNHPNWEADYNHFPQKEMESLTGYAGIEIYNGVVEYLEGEALAMDRWDQLLSSGIPAWGFAHDDTHHERLIGHGWLMAQLTEESRDGVMDALRNGRFYASTGVDIVRVSVEGGTIVVDTSNGEHIRYIGPHGRLLHKSDGPSAVYRPRDGAVGYARIDCYGRGAARAWTQPIFFAPEG